MTAEGKLVSAGHDANNLALDWTSKTGADGGHQVYMHAASDRLPHQTWAFDGCMLGNCFENEDRIPTDRN